MTGRFVRRRRLPVPLWGRSGRPRAGSARRAHRRGHASTAIVQPEAGAERTGGASGSTWYVAAAGRRGRRRVTGGGGAARRECAGGALPVERARTGGRGLVRRGSPRAEVSGLAVGARARAALRCCTALGRRNGRVAPGRVRGVGLAQRQHRPARRSRFVVVGGPERGGRLATSTRRAMPVLEFGAPAREDAPRRRSPPAPTTGARALSRPAAMPGSGVARSSPRGLPLAAPFVLRRLFSARCSRCAAPKATSMDRRRSPSRPRTFRHAFDFSDGTGGSGAPLHSRGFPPARISHDLVPRGR